MNDRTDNIMNTYVPQLAITVYKSNSTNDFYLESHNINENGQLMEGKPVLQETLQGIVDVFFDERKNISNIKGLIPDNLLSFDLLPGGNHKMVWYRPAEVRVLHFATQLKLNTGKVWVPAMLYVVNRNNLDVFSLKDDKRPADKSKLYKAPFWNVSDDGDVCLGNARVKKPKDKTFQNIMKYWEDLFWLSEFTHVNDNEKTRTDMHAVWKMLLASKLKLKWADVNELIPYKKLTLQNIIQ